MVEQLASSSDRHAQLEIHTSGQADPDQTGTTPRICIIQPSDAQLALCSLYANRWFTMKRLWRVSTRLGIKPEMKVWDQFLIRRTGQRMVTFITDIKKLDDGRKVLHFASNTHAECTLLAQHNIRLKPAVTQSC